MARWRRQWPRDREVASLNPISGNNLLRTPLLPLSPTPESLGEVGSVSSPSDEVINYGAVCYGCVQHYRYHSSSSKLPWQNSVKFSKHWDF